MKVKHGFQMFTETNRHPQSVIQGFGKPDSVHLCFLLRPTFQNILKQIPGIISFLPKVFPMTLEVTFLLFNDDTLVH